LPSLYALKPRFQQLLRPLARSLARAGVSANQVTLFTALTSCAVGAYVLYSNSYLLLPGFLFLRMALNAIDGLLAREFSQPTPLGAYLNELGDLFADAALATPFVFLNPWVMGAAIVLASISEAAGILGPAGRRNDGPLGKSDRALLYGALALAIGMGLPIPGWLPWIIVALLTLTIFNRVRQGLAA
jgi:CDP-diacylglycerol--glycerol-3-phosphate 3-phosphatidyltransferase